MKKLILITFLFSLLILNNANAGFCCNDLNTGQKKCWNNGECCGTPGYWYESCYNFEIEVKGTNVFRVGQKTPIVLNIKNTGLWSDSYTITDPPEIDSENPNLILVDMAGQTEIINVSYGQTKLVYPKITVLTNTITGIITFTGTSVNAGSKSADFNILDSDNYLSLPEFSSIIFIELIILSGAVYYFLIKKSKNVKKLGLIQIS